MWHFFHGYTNFGYWLNEKRKNRKKCFAATPTFALAVGYSKTKDIKIFKEIYVNAFFIIILYSRGWLSTIIFFNLSMSASEHLSKRHFLKSFLHPNCLINTKQKDGIPPYFPQHLQPDCWSLQQTPSHRGDIDVSRCRNNQVVVSDVISENNRCCNNNNVCLFKSLFIGVFLHIWWKNRWLNLYFHY